jgi:oligoendopeptidase F
MKEKVEKTKTRIKSSIKTSWDLTLLYKSAKDPQIEKDLLECEALQEAFAKKYQNNESYLLDEARLLEALQESEKISENPAMARPIVYFSYIKTLNTEDAYAISQLSLISNRLTQAGNKTLFFPLKLGKIPLERQQRFLASPLLKKYQYLLKNLFDDSKYHLTELEEKILNLKSLPSHSLWIEGFSKILNAETVIFKGKTLPLPAAENTIQSLNTKDRRKLSDLLMEVYKKVSPGAENEINAIIIDKKIDDELRGFKEPYSATILSYDNDEKSVLRLIDETTKAFHISQRFYKLKAKLLKVSHLEYADRSAKIGNIKKTYDFAQSVSIIEKSFRKVDARYAEIFLKMVHGGQIDVFPKKGKEGGAFCSSVTGLPTFVLLNHVNDINSLKTLAHEMGHAIHSELTTKQPVIYQDYSMSVAEVASTLFENFVFDEIFETLSEKEKIVALHDKLNGDVSTIFRQIAFFNFELELHRAIREKGNVSKDEIARMMNKHISAYVGKSMRLKDNDGYFYVTVSHFRRFFYVYSYAFGEIVSKALYKKYKDNAKFLSSINQFMEAGGSKSPENIFKDIGIDILEPSFWKDGLKKIEEDIIALEKLTKGGK